MANIKNKITLAVVGRSGCGKGTQAAFLVRHLKKQGVSLIGTGKLLRALIAKYDNPTVDIAKHILGTGKLFPAWFMFYIYLKEFIEKGRIKDNLVFDGAPRRLPEAKMLDEFIEAHGRILPLCVYLDISSKEASRRLLARGRHDDNRRAIQGRMNYFERDCLPMLNYYRRQKRLITVNGELPAEKVYEEITKALHKKLGLRWPK